MTMICYLPLFLSSLSPLSSFSLSLCIIGFPQRLLASPVLGSETALSARSETALSAISGTALSARSRSTVP